MLKANRFERDVMKTDLQKLIEAARASIPYLKIKAERYPGGEADQVLKKLLEALKPYASSQRRAVK